MVYLQQLKRDAAFKIRYVKGVPFVIRGYTKGLPFLSKMVNTKGKGFVPGASLLGEYLPPPPLPLWINVTLVWFFSLISLILCFIKWVLIHLKAFCPFFENPDMLKEIMPSVGEIKSGKMCSKICCVFLHEALGKCKGATKDLQLRTFTEKLIAGFQCHAVQNRSKYK